MSILSYNELVELVDNGIIKNITDKFKLDINSASIDIRLGDSIFIESPASSIIELNQPNPKHLKKVELRESGYLITPGQIILGSTLETLNLPNDIVAQFVLKSSIGRLFLNHMNSTHIDPGFTGNITLELQNCNSQHSIRLLPYTKIGQLVFHKVESVPDHISYNKVGQYNNSSLEPIESKGVR